MVMGPEIDPPFSQNVFRTEGVYLYPDTRVNMVGRTIVEIWGRDRECLYFGSVLSRLVTPEMQVRLWAICDEQGDARMQRAVNDSPRRIANYLQLI